MIRWGAYLSLALLPTLAVAERLTHCTFDVECGEEDCATAEQPIDLTLHTEVSALPAGVGDALIETDAAALLHNDAIPRDLALRYAPDLAATEQLYPASAQTPAIQVADRVFIVGENDSPRSEFWTVVMPQDEDERASLHVQRLAMFVLPQRTQYTGTCVEVPA